jgi:hypothetical protein
MSPISSASLLYVYTERTNVNSYSSSTNTKKQCLNILSNECKASEVRAPASHRIPTILGSYRLLAPALFYANRGYQSAQRVLYSKGQLSIRVPYRYTVLIIRKLVIRKCRGPAAHLISRLVDGIQKYLVLGID